MTTNHVLFISTEDHDEQVQNMLVDYGVQVTKISSMQELKEPETKGEYSIVLLDLDLPCVSNNSIYWLRKMTGQAWIIGFSSKRYHPELKESMRSDIFAVLGKPAHSRELQYCLHSLFDLQDG